MDWMLLAQDVKHGMTGWDFINDNWGSIVIMLGAVGTGIMTFGGALGYGIRVAWTFVADQIKILVNGHGELVTTLKENIPRQTETLGTMSELVRESRDHGSEVINQIKATNAEVQNTKAAAGEISFAMEALADAKPEDVRRYMARARQRLGIEKKPAKQSDSDS